MASLVGTLCFALDSSTIKILSWSREFILNKMYANLTSIPRNRELVYSLHENHLVAKKYAKNFNFWGSL